MVVEREGRQRWEDQFATHLAAFRAELRAVEAAWPALADEAEVTVSFVRGLARGWGQTQNAGLARVQRVARALDRYTRTHP